MSEQARPPIPAIIEHRMSGRMRLRIHSKRGDVGFFQRAARELSGWPGIRTVKTNPYTGSILVEHTGDETAWLRQAREGGLFDAMRPAPSVPAMALPRLPSLSGASPLNVAAVGLAAAGTLQVARGNLLGSASENLWNAYGLYAVTKRPWASAMLCVFGLLQLARGEALGSAVSLFLYAYSARRMARQLAVRETI
jgi:hypothetical protein